MPYEKRQVNNNNINNNNNVNNNNHNNNYNNNNYDYYNHNILPSSRLNYNYNLQPWSKMVEKKVFYKLYLHLSLCSL